MTDEKVDETALLIKLWHIGRYVTTQQLNAALLEAWGGDKHNAGMHCNSMLRRGLIDYVGEGDWEILPTLEELES